MGKLPDSQTIISGVRPLWDFWLATTVVSDTPLLSSALPPLFENSDAIFNISRHMDSSLRPTARWRGERLPENPVKTAS